MKELYEVKIDYCFAGLFGNKEIEKSEVRLFSTNEKAEAFLVDNGFVYGVPYPFRICGWYYIKGLNLFGKRIDRFLTAEIEMIELDADESYCGWKLFGFYIEKRNGRRYVWCRNRNLVLH